MSSKESDKRSLDDTFEGLEPLIELPSPRTPQEIQELNFSASESEDKLALESARVSLSPSQTDPQSAPLLDEQPALQSEADKIAPGKSEFDKNASKERNRPPREFVPSASSISDWKFLGPPSCLPSEETAIEQPAVAPAAAAANAQQMQPPKARESKVSRPRPKSLEKPAESRQAEKMPQQETDYRAVDKRKLAARGRPRVKGRFVKASDVAAGAVQPDNADFKSNQQASARSTSAKPSSSKKLKTQNADLASAPSAANAGAQFQAEPKQQPAQPPNSHAAVPELSSHTSGHAIDGNQPHTA